MQPTLTKRRSFFIACIIASAAVACVIACVSPEWLLHRLLFVLLAASSMAILAMLIHFHQWQAALDLREGEFHEATSNRLQQTDALISLLSALRPIAPLPATGGWAASPDFLRELASLVLAKRPKLIVEASSGVSTIIIAYCLKMIGGGRVISLEHDAGFREETLRQLALHHLQDFATVHHAPLTEHVLNHETYRWYDIRPIDDIASVEMLVIDGPPSVDEFDDKARFPALPLIWDKLREGAMVVMDDANRPGELKIIQRWQTSYSLATHAKLNVEKGAVVLVKQASHST